ncbi:hypothetical protein ACVOMT_16565 [Sphingomonas panni]
MFLPWAAYYEGNTDASYYDVLIPRVIDDILLSDGLRPVVVPETPAVRFGLEGREVQRVASQICTERDAFHILFVHADTGGRALEAEIVHRREAYAMAANAECGWPLERTINLSPRHETEAWALADADAVCRALGYKGDPRHLPLPATPSAAERLTDPKAVLRAIAEDVSGRSNRPSNGLLTAIAQEQSLDVLRAVPSFQAFEQELRQALATLGCLPQ